MRNIQKVIATGISVAMFTTMCVVAPAAASAEEATTTSETPYLSIVTGENNDEVIATLTESEVKALAAKNESDGMWMTTMKTGGKVLYAPKDSYVTFTALAEYAGIESYTTAYAGAPGDFPDAVYSAPKEQVENGMFFPAWDGTSVETAGASAAPAAVLLSFTSQSISDDYSNAYAAGEAAKAAYAAGEGISTSLNGAVGTTEADYKDGKVSSGKLFFSNITAVSFRGATVSYSWTAKAAKSSVKYSATKKQTVKITAKGAKGKVTYSVKSMPKKAAKKAVSVSKSGVVTFAKKAAKGTYKITVKCAGEGTTYKASSKTVTIKVK